MATEQLNYFLIKFQCNKEEQSSIEKFLKRVLEAKRDKTRQDEKNREHVFSTPFWEEDIFNYVHPLQIQKKLIWTMAKPLE